MRKGSTFIEMFIVLITLPVVTLIMSRLFNVLLTDVPKSARIVSANTRLLHMLENLQQDIDGALSLPDTFAGRDAGDELLLVKLPDAVVCYKIEQQQVSRCRLSEAPDSNAPPPTVWKIPDADIKWRLWKTDAGARAVEVTTHIIHKLRRRSQEKMANSHVYFVGAQ